MKPIKSLPILALIAGFAAPALAEPAPAKPAQEQIMAGPGDGAAGPLNAQENNSTYQQIQSPRDSATGQTTDLKSPTSSGDQPELQARTVPGRRPPSPEETALLAAGELLIHATVSPNADTKQTRRKRKSSNQRRVHKP